MFKEKQLVTIIGSFLIKEKTEEYFVFDPFEKGEVEATEKYNELGFFEFDNEGKVKDFDGFQVGDYFKLNGKYEVIRSNETFTKIKIGEDIISVPNHKIMEVE